MLEKFFGSAGSTTAEGGIRMVEPEEVLALHQAGTVVLVDVREPDEHASGIIPGAHLLPLSVFDPAKMPDPAGKSLVIHCRSGVRCGTASAALKKAGWPGEILRMRGGIMAWRAIGGPVTGR